jgi:hypothetical protein
MSYLNPRPPELDGDNVTYEVAAGGKPSTGTPADKRLKRNQPKAKPSRATPYPTPKRK